MPPPPAQPLPNSLSQELAPDAAALQPAVEMPQPPARPQFQEPDESTPITLVRPPRPLTRADLPVNLRTIFALALPTLVEQLITAAIGLTDTIVAGHTGADDATRTAATAAVGAMTYLQWFAGIMTAALGIGATAIVARAIGAHRPRLANRVAGTVCTAAFLSTLFIALLFLLFPYLPVKIFGLTGLAQTYAAQYLRIMSITLCLQAIGQIGSACLRGAGDTFRPMLITSAVTVVNGVASPALTFGWFGLPAWGIQGNATGTLLAFTISGLTTLAFLLSNNAGLRLRPRHFKILPHLLMRVLKISIPSWFESMLLWGGQVFIVIFAITSTDQAIGLSGVTLAAHQATLRIESLAFLPGFGFGIACSALVGQYLGAQKPAEAAHAVKLCSRLAFLTMFAAAIPMVFIPRYMLHFLVDSQPVITAGTWPLLIAGLAQPGFALFIVKSAALKGAGDTIYPMIATASGIILRVIIVLILITLFARFGHAAMGLTAVWICIFIDLNYRALFTTFVFRTGKWQHQKV